MDINIKYVPECLVIYVRGRDLELLALRNAAHSAVYTVCALMDGSWHFSHTATHFGGLGFQQSFDGSLTFLCLLKFDSS